MLKLVTHSGKFHADDVFSTAFIQLLQDFEQNPMPITIMRVKSETDIPTDASIVYDIGGGEYDHHQSLDKFHIWHDKKIPYASFGLLWDNLGFGLVVNFLSSLNTTEDTTEDKSYELISEITERIQDSLVVPIDAIDNGIFSSQFTASDVISDFNLSASESDENQYQAFLTAVAFAKTILKNRLTQVTNSAISAIQVVKSAVSETPQIMSLNANGSVSLVTKQNPDVKLFISSSNRGGYNVFTARDKTPDGEFVDRISISPSTINLPGVTFVHKAGFLLAADTFEHALHAAKAIIRESNESLVVQLVNNGLLYANNKKNVQEYRDVLRAAGYTEEHQYVYFPNKPILAVIVANIPQRTFQFIQFIPDDKPEKMSATDLAMFLK